MLLYFAFLCITQFNLLPTVKKTLLLLTILFGAALSLRAQNNKSTPTVSAGFSFGATTGPNSDHLPVALGLHVKLEYPVANRVSVILTSGYTVYLPAEGYNYDARYGSSGEGADFIPVTIGARFYTGKRIFIQGDVGASFNLNPADLYTGNKVALLVSPGVGYAFKFGSSRYGLDLSAAYDTRIEKSAASNIDPKTYNPYGSFSSVVFKVAFRFGL
jgi:hypothetical protein